MQVKKFEAPTIAEALKLVKTELGPDAIILSTKTHRKGFGLLSKPSVEVTAAVSERALTNKRITERTMPEAVQKQIGQMSTAKQKQTLEKVGEYYQQKMQARAPVQEVKRERSTQPTQAGARPGQITAKRYIDITDDEAEVPRVNYARNARPEVFSELSSSGMNTAPIKTSAFNEEAIVRTRTESQLIEEVDRLKQMLAEMKSEAPVQMTDGSLLSHEFSILLQNGVDKKYANSLIRAVQRDLSTQEILEASQARSNNRGHGHSGSNDKVLESIAMQMLEDCKTRNLLGEVSNHRSRVCAVVGPTGVGKTTTIAKIASLAILNHQLKVGLINIDTFKVGASDQLATYARILNTPYRSVKTTSELEQALIELRPMDLILLDTAGRSQRDVETLNTVRAMFDDAKQVAAHFETIIALSATTRDQEIYDAIARLNVFRPTGVVVTKLDEATTFGCLYNISQKSKLPLCYFTQGQRVPEDIEIATPERVVDLVLDL